MFIDARTLEPGTTLETDVCIVGAGPSGLAVALALAGARARVILVESGGLEVEGRIQRLSEGRARGPLVGPRNRYLRASRTRAFGGLATAWRGSCRPFAREEIAAREWVEGSGWPLDYEELAPWLERAAQLLEVELRPSAAPPPLLPAVDPGFETVWLPHALRPALGERFRERFAAAPVEVLLHATASRLALDEAGRRVTEVDLRSFDGPRLRLRAGWVVLAAGALESARLLLLSDDRRAGGLGNEHDLVGRYFSEQVVMRAGYAVLSGRDRPMAAYESAVPGDGRSYPARAVFEPSPALQRRHELLASLVTLEPARAEETGDLASAVAAWASDLRRLHAARAPVDEDHFAAVEVRGEQVPDRASRVRLGDERDAFGLRRLDLRWRLSEHDIWSLRATARLFADNLGRHGIGRMRTDAGRLSRRTFGWSGHQSGTTRMSLTASTGVVDPSCRVHDVDNLFVAGSAVFPTGGCSGPMLTGMALALRLGDHLGRTMESV